MSLRMWLNGMCVIDERLYLFRIQSDILNRTRVENNVDEIHVSCATEMADLSRHFKWGKNQLNGVYTVHGVQEEHCWTKRNAIFVAIVHLTIFN